MSPRTARGYARLVTEPVPTPRYHRVLGASVEVARDMSKSYVGVEHLFLAMIHDRHAVPTQVLARMADLDVAGTINVIDTANIAANPGDQ